MKIHFFVRTLDEATGGGSHYNSIAYMRALMAAGHTVVAHVMYDVPYNSFPEGITPIVHKGFGLSFLQERKLIAELLKQYENEADIFFLYAVEFAWGGGLYRRTGGKKPVVVFMDAYLSSMRRVKPKNFSLWLYQFKRLPWDKTIGLCRSPHTWETLTRNLGFLKIALLFYQVLCRLRLKSLQHITSKQVRYRFYMLADSYTKKALIC
jgi:hypothetical protein